MANQGMGALHVFMGFAFYYPLFMAYLWMIGAVFYYFRYERPPKGWPRGKAEQPPALPDSPPVSFVVPCHNEGRDIEDTVEYLLASTYPAFDILLVNDGSSDETPQILDALAAQHPKIRVVHLLRNQGYPNAEVVGVLFVPAQERDGPRSGAVANTYAALTELNHYSSGQMFSARYDEGWPSSPPHGAIS